MISAHAILRTATSDRHAQVDAAYGHFDLADRTSYTQFLRAHARTLALIERTMQRAPEGFPSFRTRLHDLAADLASLGCSLPDPLPPIAGLSDAAVFGMLYVAEGSRLGGGVLAARVGADLPTSYLRAIHLKGEWRSVLASIDAAALNKPESWADALIDGANRTFDLYIKGAMLSEQLASV